MEWKTANHFQTLKSNGIWQKISVGFFSQPPFSTAHFHTMNGFHWDCSGSIQINHKDVFVLLFVQEYWYSIVYKYVCIYMYMNSVCIWTCGPSLLFLTTGIKVGESNGLIMWFDYKLLNCWSEGCRICRALSAGAVCGLIWSGSVPIYTTVLFNLDLTMLD